MNKKKLTEYTDDELFDILQKNYNTKSLDLCYFCSEVIRRQLLKERVNNENK